MPADPMRHTHALAEHALPSCRRLLYMNHRAVTHLRGCVASSMIESRM